MLVANYIILFVIIISLGILYQKYLEKQSNMIEYDNYGEIKKSNSQMRMNLSKK